MTERLWTTFLWRLGLTVAFSVPCGQIVSVFAQTPAAEQAKSAERKLTPINEPGSEPTAGEKAWEILRDALKSENADKRAKAVRALGLLPGNTEAEKAAINALQDKKPNVRMAAATALGLMQAQHAKPELEGALLDSEPTVALAAANSLLLLHDDVGYDLYYDVLTGEKRASKGLVREQLEMLKDKKKVAKLGFEEGIGFIPFAGMGYEAFKTVSKNDSSPVRAAAAKQLAHDPDPGTAKALVKASTDKNWAVREAALEAIAQRDDPSLVPNIAPALEDQKDVVRFTAAACVAHLSDLPVTKSSEKTTKP